MHPRTMTAVLNRKRYSTETAKLLAGNDWWDGNNFERSGRQSFLYRTPKGAYFATHLTCWQGERDSIEPLTADEAASLWESLTEQRMEFDEAFPGLTVEEA